MATADQLTEYELVGRDHPVVVRWQDWDLADGEMVPTTQHEVEATLAWQDPAGPHYNTSVLLLTYDGNSTPAEAMPMGNRLLAGDIVEVRDPASGAVYSFDLAPTTRGPADVPGADGGIPVVPITVQPRPEAGLETLLTDGAALEVVRAFLTIPGIGHTRLNNEYGIDVAQIVSEAYRIGQELAATLARLTEAETERDQLLSDLAAVRRVFGFTPHD